MLLLLAFVTLHLAVMESNGRARKEGMNTQEGGSPGLAAVFSVDLHVFLEKDRKRGKNVK